MDGGTEFLRGCRWEKQNRQPEAGENEEGDSEGNSFGNAQTKDTKNREPFGWLSSNDRNWLSFFLGRQTSLENLEIPGGFQNAEVKIALLLQCLKRGLPA